MSHLYETRTITLKKGFELQISMTPEFIAHVRKFFELEDDKILPDALIKRFLTDAVKNAIPTEGGEFEDAQRTKGNSEATCQANVTGEAHPRS